MPIAEPMTLVTDYVLAGLGFVLGLRLRRLGESGDPCRWWAGALWAMSLAALLGGSAHGFARVISDAVHAQLWGGTMLALGAASVLLAYAVVITLGWSRIWGGVLIVEFLLYALWVIFVDSDFRYAVLQYGMAFLLVLVAHIALWWRGYSGARTVVAGVVVSFVAAWIQQAEISPHRVFNHNDLYHVVQMVGLLLLYRGVAAGASDQAATKAELTA